MADLNNFNLLSLFYFAGEGNTEPAQVREAFQQNKSLYFGLCLKVAHTPFPPAHTLFETPVR